jgi:hypothetical protein
MGEIGLDQDRRVNRTSRPEIAWKRGRNAHALARPRWRRRRRQKCGTVDRREYTSSFVSWDFPDAIRAFRRFPHGGP